MIVTISLLFLLLFFDVIFLIKIISDVQSSRGGAPFVGIPIEVARKALKLAQVSKDDVFYDLGCGDGKVLRLATQEFGVTKAIGYEVALWPWLKSQISSASWRIRSQNSKLTICRRDLLTADLSEATIIFLYLSANLSEKLGPKLSNELPVGARIITCRYPLLNINNFKIVKIDEVKGIKIWVYKNCQRERDFQALNQIHAQIPTFPSKEIENDIKQSIAAVRKNRA